MTKLKMYFFQKLVLGSLTFRDTAVRAQIRLFGLGYGCSGPIYGCSEILVRVRCSAVHCSRSRSTVRLFGYGGEHSVACSGEHSVANGEQCSVPFLEQRQA